MKRTKEKKKLFSFILIFSILTIVLIFLNTVNFLSNINSKLTDNLYGSKVPLDNIVIIAIDDESLQQIGRWPWDRKVFAEVINKLNESKVIGIDLGFYETSNNSSDEILKNTLIQNENKIVLSCEYVSFKTQKDNDKDDIVYGEKILTPNTNLKYEKAEIKEGLKLEKQELTKEEKSQILERKKETLKNLKNLRNSEIEKNKFLVNKNIFKNIEMIDDSLNNIDDSLNNINDSQIKTQTTDSDDPYKQRYLKYKAKLFELRNNKKNK